MLVAVILSVVLGLPASWAQTSTPRDATDTVVSLEMRLISASRGSEVEFQVSPTVKAQHLQEGGAYLLKNGRQRIGAFRLVSWDEQSRTAVFSAVSSSKSRTDEPFDWSTVAPNTVITALTRFRAPASVAREQGETLRDKRGYRPDHRTGYVAWSSFAYTETLKPKLTSNHIAIGASYRYEITQNRLDLWANTDLRLIPVTSKLSEALETSESIHARLVDAGVGLSLQILPKRKPLGLGIMAGGHYSTMYVTNDRFGYAHFSAPIVGIPLYYVLPTGQALDFEVSYAFLRTVDFNYSNSNRRLAIKLSSTSLLTTNESLGLFIHYNNVNLTLNTVKLEMNELIGGLSFRW